MYMVRVCALSLCEKQRLAIEIENLMLVACELSLEKEAVGCWLIQHCIPLPHFGYSLVSHKS